MLRRRLLGSALQATGRLRPELLVLDVTHACNSRCGGCGFRDPEPGELTTERWVALAREGAALGSREIMVTGGEPLLRPDISALLPALGALLSVSLDGAGDETWARIRGVLGLSAALPRLLDRGADPAERTVEPLLLPRDLGEHATWAGGGHSAESDRPARTDPT